MSDRKALRGTEDFIRSFSTYIDTLPRDIEYTLVRDAQSGTWSDVYSTHETRHVEPSRRAMEILLRQHARQILYIAKKSRGRGVALWDLYSEGQIGFMKAVEKFDPEKGFRLSTYAAWWIKQSMSRAIMNDGATIRLPVHVHEFNAALQKVRKRLQNEKGRDYDPTDEELAEHMLTLSGVHPWQESSIEKIAKRVHTSRNSRSFRTPTSLDAPADPEGWTALVDLLEGKICPDGLEKAIDGDDRKALKDGLRKLSPREHHIVIERFVKERTLDDVASEMTNLRTGGTLTRERVRQIEGRALNKLRKLLSPYYFRRKTPL